MLAMRNYKVIVSNKATADLDSVARFIASIHRPESGHNFVNKILGKLAALSYTADIYQYSQLPSAKTIHPKAKTITILNHRWTIVFHIEKDYVMVDRIIPSKLMAN